MVGYCPVDNLVVHEIMQNFCHISSDKKVKQQRVLWGYSPICNRSVMDEEYEQNERETNNELLKADEREWQ